MMDVDVAQSFKTKLESIHPCSVVDQSLLYPCEGFKRFANLLQFEFRLDDYERETEADRIKAVSASHSIKTYERVTWAVFAAALSVISIYLTK